MRIFYKALLIILFAVGILLLALSFLSFNTVKSFVESLCNEGRVNFLNQDFYSKIIYRLRLSSYCYTINCIINGNLS